MSKVVKIRQNTYDDLEDLKAPGQSFDGVITELINENTEKVNA
jgi:predicted CopG family antitoxin